MARRATSLTTGKAATLKPAQVKIAEPVNGKPARSATFDWPAIEAVAAVSGANQAMAKLLLAARAEGANSRWPF